MKAFLHAGRAAKRMSAHVPVPASSFLRANRNLSQVPLTKVLRNLRPISIAIGRRSTTTFGMQASRGNSTAGHLSRQRQPSSGGDMSSFIVGLGIAVLLIVG